MVKILDMGGKETAQRKGAKNAKTVEPEEAAPYSRNPEFLGQAFSLFCKGLSLPNVAAALMPEWPDVKLRTLQRIAKEQDWVRTLAALTALHSQAQASAEGLLPEVVMTLQKIRAQMESRVLVKPGDIFAYRALVEDLMWYTGKHPKLKDATPLAVSGDVEIAALLEAIAEDEVVAGAWKRRRSHIDKAYREKLEKKEKTQRKGAKNAKGK